MGGNFNIDPVQEYSAHNPQHTNSDKLSYAYSRTHAQQNNAKKNLAERGDAGSRPELDDLGDSQEFHSDDDDDSDKN
jgi:hypothetical protein